LRLVIFIIFGSDNIGYNNHHTGDPQNEDNTISIATNLSDEERELDI
jgi:hypothetical protein